MGEPGQTNPECGCRTLTCITWDQVSRLNVNRAHSFRGWILSKKHDVGRGREFIPSARQLQPRGIHSLRKNTIRREAGDLSPEKARYEPRGFSPGETLLCTDSLLVPGFSATSTDKVFRSNVNRAYFIPRMFVRPGIGCTLRVLTFSDNPGTPVHGPIDARPQTQQD